MRTVFCIILVVIFIAAFIIHLAMGVIHPTPTHFLYVISTIAVALLVLYAFANNNSPENYVLIDNVGVTYNGVSIPWDKVRITCATYYLNPPARHLPYLFISDSYVHVDKTNEDSLPRIYLNKKSLSFILEHYNKPINIQDTEFLYPYARVMLKRLNEYNEKALASMEKSG